MFADFPLTADVHVGRLLLEVCKRLFSHASFVDPWAFSFGRHAVVCVFLLGSVSHELVH